MSNHKDYALIMRPKNIDQIAGNIPAKKILQGKTSQTMPKAILIHGEPGCAKTTIARIILFDILGGSEECIREFNMGTEGGIDTARKIENEVNFRPGVGPINGWIFDEAHKSEKKTISALLKPTEDGSANFNYFIFCTSDLPEFLKKISPKEQKAFLSRCMEIKVGPITDDEGFNMMADCLDHLKIADKVSDDVIDEILKVSEGIPRVMYKNLETVVGMKTCGDMIEHLKTCNYSTDEYTPEMRQFYLHILNGDWKKCADFLSVLRKAKTDVEAFKYPMMGFMLTAMLDHRHPNSTELVREKAAFCVENLTKPLYEGRIYQFSAIVRKACMLKKGK